VFLDLDRVLARRLATTERDHGIDTRCFHCHLFAHPPAPAKADCTDLAVGIRIGLQKLDRRNRIGDGVGSIESADHLARLILIRGRAARRWEEVGAERDEAFERRLPHDVLDVRIKVAILVDHEHRRQLAAGLCRSRQIALDVAGFGSDRAACLPATLLWP